MNIKTEYLDKSTIATSSNVLYVSSFLKSILSLWFLHDDTNETHTYDPGGADRVISMTGIKADGNVFCTAGWGTGGFSVNTIDNSGTMSQVYQDTYPANSYGNWQCLALDKVNHVAYVASYGTTGIVPYDYSDVYSGGSTVVKGTVIKEVDGLYADQFGTSYVNGIGIAGDYLYYSPYEKTATGVIHRWKLSTSTNEAVTVQNTRSTYRYGAVNYSPYTDRMYIQNTSGYELIVVTDASHATNVRAFHIRYDDIPGVNYYSYPNINIEDVNNRNHIWCGDSQRIFKIDITDCIVDGVIVGTAPTLLSGLIDMYNDAFIYSPYMRFNDSTSYGSDFIYVLADRGWCDSGGWFDPEYENIIANPQYNSNFVHASMDNLRFSYAAEWIPIYSPNMTKYWIVSGYDSDGNKFRSYTDANCGGLRTSGYIKFGSFYLDDTANIGTVRVNGTGDFYQPTGTSLTIQVSNNGGSSWENYTIGTIHTFSSTGNALQVQINLTGNGKSSAYYYSNTTISLTFAEDYDYDTPVKYVKTKLQGGH